MHNDVIEIPVNGHQAYPIGNGSARVSSVMEARDVSVRYGAVEALRNVSLKLDRNRITALIGPSGCGKTSFLSCLNRLTDMVASCRVTGSIQLDGHDIHHSTMDVQGLRRQVGMIFQKPNPFPLSIRRNLEMPLREHGVRNRPELEQRIGQALRDVGLWDEVKDRLNRPALSLSGGQQQRLCIARALVLQPSVLLMDEPCSALDPLSSAVVEDLILRLKERYTVVIVTHNLGQARRIADQVAFFWWQDGAGQLIEAGRGAHLFESPKHELTAAYISGARG